MRLRGVIDRLLAVSILISIAGGLAIAAEGQSASKREVRAIDRIIVTEPLPEVAESNRLDIAAVPNAMSLRMAQPQSGNDAATQPLIPSEPSRGLLVWLMLTCLIAAGGWLGWSQQAAVAARFRSGLNSVPWALGISRSLKGRISAMGGQVLGSMASSRTQPGAGATYSSEPIEARLARAIETVAMVPRAAPLREVLDDELRRVRHRLGVAQIGGDGGARGRLTAPAFRVIQRDLDRIERIAVSAQRSIGGPETTASGAVAMPSSVDEAYEVLGINSNVSEATLKKILDALRMSWHPDLAGDAADRHLREERIKQINIASELIAAERRAA